MAIGLEEVEQKFVASVLEYLGALDAAIAKSEEFARATKDAEDALIQLSASATDAAAVIDAAMGTATGAVHDLRDAFAGAAAAAQGLKGAGADTGLGGAAAQAAVLQRELADISGDLMMQTDLLRGMAVALGVIQRDVADTSADLMMQTGLLRDIRDLLMQSAGAALILGNRMRDMGGGGAARTGLRLFGGWFGAIMRNGNALHWFISGFIELAAVVIPAMVAGAAWAAVWLQGATNVAQHMQAVYTATEATANIFHMTAGQAVGLGHALQTAQNAANPNVYQALGSAILTVKEHFSGLATTGLQVGRVFDTFMAKVVQDFAPGGSLGGAVDSLLSHMVPDLTQLGQVFGNLGHAILSFASQMPGLAELLLGMLAGFTRILVVVTDLAGKFSIFGVSILTLAIGIEEFNRWGGLLVGLFGRMGLATVALEGKFFTLTRAASVVRAFFSIIPALIGNAGVALGLLSTRLEGAGAAMVAFSARMQGAIEALGLWGTLGVAAAAVGLGILIDKIVTGKSAAQAFADSLEAGITKASNVQAIAAIGAAMGSLNHQLATATTNFRNVGTAAEPATTGFKTAGVAAAAARDNVMTLTSAQQHLAEQFAATGAHAVALANKYHTSLIGAMALADQAGVKLANTLTGPQWALAQIKIASLVQGWKAMGTPMGAVGSDINALAIQSGLAASQVSKLNSAWDDFMTNLTGGTSGLAAFNTALTNLSTGANQVTNVLGKSGSVTLSIKDFAQSLTTFTGKGAQAWTNFNQVVGSTAPQLIDWFRTAGAEGAMSGKQFQQGILDMLSSLTPLASKSKAAQTELLGLAQEAGLGIHTFPQLEAAIKKTGASGQDLAKIVAAATTKMGDMAAVAQQLGTALQNDVIAAMSQAKIAASGLSQDTLAYVKALNAGNASAAKGGPLYNAVASDLKLLGYSGKQASQVIGMLTGQTDAAARSAENYYGKLAQVRNMLAQIKSKTVTINVDILQHGGITLPGMPIGTRITAGAKGIDSAPRGVALVGEEGPELMMMKGGETVVPHEHTQALLKLAGGLRGIPGFAAGTGNVGQLEHQLARELAVLVQRLLGASSISGMSQLTGNLLSTLKQLTADHHIGKAEDSRLTRLIRDDNKKLDTLFRERQKILNRIKAADAYAKNVSQAAQGTASLSTIMGSAGGGPVSSAFLLASMKIDLAGIRRFDSDIKKLEKLGLDKALLNQIIQMGPVQGDQVAQALINGPLANIKALNATESQVQQASKNLGHTTANRMFDAGKNAGKGFLSGLKGEEAQLEKEMRHLADTMVGTLRRELGLGGGNGRSRQHHVSAHGPMHVVGQHIIEGVAGGIGSRMPHLDVSLRGAAGHVSSALGSAAGSGGGGITINVTIPVETKLDSRPIYQAVQTQSLRVNRRNPSNNLTLPRGRGG